MNRSLLRSITLAVACTLATPPVARAQTQQIELPTLGDVAVDDLSPANERKLGEAIMRQALRDPSYLPDPDATEYLNKLGYQLVAASSARHMDFSFFVVRDPMLNAFALPGGFIGVHTGLVIAAQSESELAAVLAHEIGHVEQRHIARLLAKSRETMPILIGALLLALLAARSNSSSAGDLTQAAILGGQAAAIQQQLNFSREAEREADRVGFQILTGAGFDAGAMVSFFTRLQQGSRIYESAAPAYLRTHPLTVERIGDMQNRLREKRTRQRADSLDFLLARARLRILQDESVQGLRDARDFFAGQLANRTTTSEVATYYGLALANLKLGDAKLALEHAAAARKRAAAPTPMLEKLYAQARFASADTPQERDAAIAFARETTTRFPLSRLTALNYVDLLQQAGRHEEAIAYLREQIAVPRSEPKHYELLARSYAALNRRTLQHQATAELYAALGATPAAIEQLQLARKAADADFYVLSEVDARLRQLTQQLKEQREELARSGRRPDEARK
ncbi:MAG TPA: M48 family metalloprotease [Burkholderiaceae bacterium]|nr:M48 family metalloprotease [Burkholderiaceae bacterium]